jgi:hypothetical protein
MRQRPSMGFLGGFGRRLTSASSTRRCAGSTCTLISLQKLLERSLAAPFANVRHSAACARHSQAVFICWPRAHYQAQPRQPPGTEVSQCLPDIRLLVSLGHPRGLSPAQAQNVAEMQLFP